MARISRTWQKAGSLPGQYQKLTITFVKRDGDDVTVKIDFYAKSLGYDYYNYSSRHNDCKIYCLDKTIDSWSYQAYGTKASSSHSKTVTVHNVKNADNDLVFYYSNSRAWPGHSNSWDPRSTGVVSKTKVGELTIPKNKKEDIEFYEVINDNNKTKYKCYHDNKFTIPKDLIPKNHFFNFTGWRRKEYDFDYLYANNGSGGFIVDYFDKSKLPQYNAKYNPGEKIVVENDLEFYACWYPKSCKYAFFDTDNNKISELVHQCGTYTRIPDLDILQSDPGYVFNGWKCGYNTYSAGNKCAEWPNINSNTVNFYAQVAPANNEVIFNMPGGAVHYNYETNAEFDMYTPLEDCGVSNPTISIKPGYRLVGWCTCIPSQLSSYDSVDSTGHAFPGQAFTGLQGKSNYYVGDTFIIYPISGNVIFEYSYFKNNTLILYPYYEYYTTSYVYVDGQWKLAMPYVYTQDGWKMALSYVYTEDGWKL